MTLRRRSQFLATILMSMVAAVCTSAETFAAQGEPLKDLGEKLFFDRSLSLHRDTSCASCHQPGHAFTDGRTVAVGTGHRSGTRNTPSLLALGEGPFFWDGRAARLEAVVPQPFTNPVEMGLTSQDALLVRLRSNPVYVSAFSTAFPVSADSISIPNVAQAIATYLRTLAAPETAYDRFASHHDQSALSPQARHGLALFEGSAGCVECHKADAAQGRFTDDEFHSTLINPKLAPVLPNVSIQLASLGLNSSEQGLKIEADQAVSELGRYVVTLDPRDIGSFRTPSLRDVARTAPYMHDGSVATLREAVDREIYYRNLQSNRPNTLTEQDRGDLVAFLLSLSLP